MMFFSDLGGARQVIVPMKFAWIKDRFQQVLSSHTFLTSAEVKAHAKIYKPLFAGIDKGQAPPELSEALLRLCSSGDEANAKRLLHYAWPSERSGEQKYWQTLKRELKSKLNDWKVNQIVSEESK